MKTQTVIAPLPSCSNTAVRGETSKINHPTIMKSKRKNLLRPVLSLAACFLGLAAPMCANAAVTAVNDIVSVPEDTLKTFPSVLNNDTGAAGGTVVPVQGFGPNNALPGSFVLKA